MALYGTDQSVWQPNTVGDGDFIVLKATGSDMGNYVDPTCDAKYQMNKAAGKLLGVYHFADPTAGSAEDQAKFFVDNIKGYVGEAILVLDWEKGVSNTAWAKAWLDKVYALTGVKPLIYMSASVVNGYDWSAVAKADYGLFIAGYPAQYNVPNPPTPSVSDMPFGIGAWKFWAIWQYSSSAGLLDRDIANMDKSAWKVYAGKKGETKPTPAPAPASKPTQDYQTYVVKAGDNLSLIAAKYGTTYQKIAKDNGIKDPNKIYPNQVLKIYPNGSAPASENYKTYVVQSGDSLSSIAAKYGTTWQKIYNDNKSVIGGDPSLIYPGQVLKIY